MYTRFGELIIAYPNTQMVANGPPSVKFAPLAQTCSYATMFARLS